MKNQKLYLTLGAVGVLLVAVVAVVALQGKGGNLSGNLSNVVSIPKASTSNPGNLKVDQTPTITILPANKTFTNLGKSLNVLNFKLTATKVDVHITPTPPMGRDFYFGIAAFSSKSLEAKNCLLKVDGTSYPALPASWDLQRVEFNIDKYIPVNTSKDFSLFCDIEKVQSGTEFAAQIFEIEYNGTGYEIPYTTKTYGPTFLVP